MKKYIFLMALLICYSCGYQSETAIDTADRMKGYACEGNLEAFYGIIDRASVDEVFKKLAIDIVKENKGSTSHIEDFEEIVLPSLIVLKWEIISRELQKGPDGDFCNMEIFNLAGEDLSAYIVFPDGKTSTWGFDKRKGQLVLNSIVDRNPFYFADLNLDLKSNPKDIHEKIANIEKKASNDIEKTDTPKPIATKAPQVVEPTSTPEIAKHEQQDTKTEAVSEETAQQVEVSPKPDDSAQPTPSPQAPLADYDFGVARWGMTREQVISSEGKEPILESADSLKYYGSYYGASAELEYIFTNNRLVRGRYIVLGSGTDENSYLKDFERVKGILTSKYGRPANDREIWTNTLYKDKPDRHAFAVYIGHLSYRTKWVTRGVAISLELKSNNYNMLLESIYSYK